MNRYIGLVVGIAALMAAAPVFAMDAGEVVPCRQNVPREARSLAGMFTVHVVCDQVLFEIPPAMLNRDMISNIEFAALSTGSDDLALGSLVDNRVVRWTRRGNKVYFESVKYEMWARNMPNLQRGVEDVSLPIIIKVFDAVAEGRDGAPIIDVTPLFVTEVPEGFAQKFKIHFRMSAVDPKRSYIQNVKAFPQNIEVRMYQTWVPDPKDINKPGRGGQGPVPPSLGFVFHTSLLLLPENPMMGRYADDRVGYFTTPFDDYGTNDHRAVRRAFINRYRLEKKDSLAAVSEPVKPIVFYLSREVPDRWRFYIKKGIEDWNVVLEKAGFRNAILARDAPTEQEDPQWDPEDARYSVIRWTPSARQNAMGPGLVDPRSGEVISSHALFWNDVLKLAETWYFTQVGPLDPRARKLPLPDDLMGELLRYVVAHEIGHALGLRHNFKGHSAYTVEQLRSREWTERWGTSASIMDYARFNYVAQPGDNAYLLPKFGPYDFFAIEWGYKPVATAQGCDDEWPELDRMAARQVDEPMLRFGGEDQFAGLDPGVNTNVLGADPIRATEMGLRNIDRVVPMLIPATTQLGRDYSRLEEVYYALISQRHKELSAVAKLVGGVEEIRYQAGRGDLPFKPVAAERQRQAVKFLVDRAFATPKSLLNPDVLRRIAQSGGADPLQGSNISLLQQILDAGVFIRMAEARASGGQGRTYLGIDMLKDLNNGIFGELDEPQPAIDLYRRDLQRNYVTLLLVAAGSASDPSAASEEIQSGRGFASGTRKGGGSEWSLWSPLAETAQDFKAGRGRPSEMRAALRLAIGLLAKKIDASMKNVRDTETALHLRDLRAELDNGP